MKKSIIILAIFVSLSWFIIAIFSEVIQKYFDFPINYSTWDKISILRMLLGIFIFLVLFPIIIKNISKDNYLTIIGFESFRFNYTISFLMLPLILTFVLGYSINELLNQYNSTKNIIVNLQPAFIEELAVRGILIYLLKKLKLQNWKIILICFVVFASYHYSYGIASLITGFVSIFCMTIPRLISKNVSASIYNHILMNVGLFVPVFLSSILIIIYNYFFDKENKKLLLT